MTKPQRIEIDGKLWEVTRKPETRGPLSSDYFMYVMPVDAPTLEDDDTQEDLAEQRLQNIEVKLHSYGETLGEYDEMIADLQRQVEELNAAVTVKSAFKGAQIEVLDKRLTSLEAESHGLRNGYDWLKSREGQQCEYNSKEADKRWKLEQRVESLEQTAPAKEGNAVVDFAELRKRTELLAIHWKEEIMSCIKPLSGSM